MGAAKPTYQTIGMSSSNISTSTGTSTSTSTGTGTGTSIESFVARHRAAKTRDEKMTIMHELHAFRAFEALVAKHGSVDAAQAVLNAIKSTAAQLRERELASMGAWGQLPASTSTSSTSTSI